MGRGSWSGRGGAAGQALPGCSRHRPRLPQPRTTHRGFHFGGQNQLFLFLQKAKEKGKLATGKPSKWQGLGSHRGRDTVPAAGLRRRDGDSWGAAAHAEDRPQPHRCRLAPRLFPFSSPSSSTAEGSPPSPRLHRPTVRPSSPRRSSAPVRRPRPCQTARSAPAVPRAALVPL